MWIEVRDGWSLDRMMRREYLRGQLSMIGYERSPEIIQQLKEDIKKELNEIGSIDNK